MAVYWLSTLDPDEKGFYSVDWTDEMDAASDSISGTPTFSFIDGSVYGLQITDVAIATGNKKVNLYASNSDPDSNRTDVLANSPYLIDHKIDTTNGQELHRVLGLQVVELGNQLVIEDGTIVSGANSLVTLAEADLYHLNHGNTDWSGTDSERARKVIRAQQFYDGRYRMRLKGVKTNSDQVLTWPRDVMVDEDGYSVDADEIPQLVKDSVCEIARTLPSTQKITQSASLKRVKAGSVEVEYFSESKQREVLDLADELNRPYLRPAGTLTRA